MWFIFKSIPILKINSVKIILRHTRARACRRQRCDDDDDDSGTGGRGLKEIIDQLFRYSECFCVCRFLHIRSSERICVMFSMRKSAKRCRHRFGFCVGRTEIRVMSSDSCRKNARTSACVSVGGCGCSNPRQCVCVRVCEPDQKAASDTHIHTNTRAFSEHTVHRLNYITQRRRRLVITLFHGVIARRRRRNGVEYDEYVCTRVEIAEQKNHRLTNNNIISLKFVCWLASESSRDKIPDMVDVTMVHSNYVTGVAVRMQC